jgi:hypothetical protein
LPSLAPRAARPTPVLHPLVIAPRAAPSDSATPAPRAASSDSATPAPRALVPRYRTCTHGARVRPLRLALRPARAVLRLAQRPDRAVLRLALPFPRVPCRSPPSSTTTRWRPAENMASVSRPSSMPRRHHRPSPRHTEAHLLTLTGVLPWKRNSLR